MAVASRGSEWGRTACSFNVHGGLRARHITKESTSHLAHDRSNEPCTMISLIGWDHRMDHCAIRAEVAFGSFWQNLSYASRSVCLCLILPGLDGPLSYHAAVDSLFCGFASSAVAPLLITWLHLPSNTRTGRILAFSPTLIRWIASAAGVKILRHRQHSHVNVNGPAPFRPYTNARTSNFYVKGEGGPPAHFSCRPRSDTMTSPWSYPWRHLGD